jgi:hypothetical protein
LPPLLGDAHRASPARSRLTARQPHATSHDAHTLSGESGSGMAHPNSRDCRSYVRTRVSTDADAWKHSAKGAKDLLRKTLLRRPELGALARSAIGQLLALYGQSGPAVVAWLALC